MHPGVQEFCLGKGDQSILELLHHKSVSLFPYSPLSPSLPFSFLIFLPLSLCYILESTNKTIKNSYFFWKYS